MNSQADFKPGYLALSGGVGGAKLALGLAQVLSPDELLVVCNTGDDFEHLGLTICPDLDTVLYTLAGRSNKELGWGQEDESWQFLAALDSLGGETWFRLGDRDLATHHVRTSLMKQGLSLSQVVDYLREKMGIRHRVAPMTDDRVRTQVMTQEQGTLPFQEYFVKERCEPRVTGFEFAGIDQASLSPGLKAGLHDGLKGIIICPSNPFVSVNPILQLPGLLESIASLGVPVVVVSNIVGGTALKGPAAKMMEELNLPVTALGVAQFYHENFDLEHLHHASSPQAKKGNLVSHFVLDSQDASHQQAIEGLGFAVTLTNTVMLSLSDRANLAAEIIKVLETAR